MPREMDDDDVLEEWWLRREREEEDDDDDDRVDVRCSAVSCNRLAFCLDCHSCEQHCECEPCCG